MTMLESGDLGPNERIVYDIQDGKQYPLCGVYALGILGVTALIFWVGILLIG